MSIKPPSAVLAPNWQTGNVGKPLRASSSTLVPNTEATQQAKIEKAGEQFEAMMLQEMLKSMWSTVPSGGMLTSSHEEEMFRDMLNEAVAGTISHGEGIGIKNVVIKDIKQLEHLETGAKPSKDFSRLNKGKVG